MTLKHVQKIKGADDKNGNFNGTCEQDLNTLKMY